MDVLAQFNHLEKSGALDALANLRKENRELDKIIVDAALLVAYTNVDEMLDFIMERLLDHFIPCNLVFLIQPPRGDKLRQYHFRNLKKVDETLDPSYYDTLRNRFERLPGRALFGELEEEFGQAAFGADFRSLSPEIVYPMFGIGGVYGIAISGRRSSAPPTPISRRNTSTGCSASSRSACRTASTTKARSPTRRRDYSPTTTSSQARRGGRFTKRHGSRSGILMMDVDHFKRFNDTYGHVMGDAALIALAEKLKRSTRAEDCVARYGGEEFCVLVSPCTPTTLFDLAERIKGRDIGDSHTVRDRDLSITVSLGARMIEPFDPPILLGDADKALYRSKKLGRNRTTIFAQGLLERAVACRIQKEPAAAGDPVPEGSVR
jgi:diguanylate cyclase (GGDEF)-like protein